MIRSQGKIARRVRVRPTIEVVIDSAESAVAAEKGGATRVELCANLPAGGTTPSVGMIARVRRICSLPLYVMIRPRGGDFVYGPGEFEVMKRDVQVACNEGADGVVLGVLETNGVVDRRRTAQLIKLAQPLGVTFHRAFDMTRDPMEALDAVLETGAERILTSGLMRSAFEGRALIRTLVKIAGTRLAIMAGGGVNHKNVATILAETGVREVHVGSAVASPVPGGARGGHPPDRAAITVVNAVRVRDFVIATELPAPVPGKAR